MDAYALKSAPLTQGPRHLAPPSYRMPRPLVLAMAISTICFIVLSMHLPVGLFADASFDDGLFVKHAESIVAGHWLGPYSQMTLAKGPGYPLFLAFNAILGLPITLTQALLYCGSCAVLTITLFRIFGTAWICLLSFLLMQWHPAVFTEHIVRDDLSAPQVLLILGCVCRFVFLPTGPRNRLSWAVMGGVLLGWFWMTREDAVWVLPGLAVIVLLQGVRLLPAWPEVKRLAAAVASFGLAWLVTLSVVAATNLAAYGTFTVEDFKSPQFSGAVNALQSVRVGEPMPYVPVPAKVRQRLDVVSPAFASLEPYLHGQGQAWMQPGCAIYPLTCGDFAGGWFMWALRDAVASQGYYRSPATASAFYRKLQAQVDAACEAGQLKCRKNFIPFMPAMQSRQWNQLPAALRRMYGLATWQIGQPEWMIHERTLLRSTGDPGQIDGMESFLGNPLRAPMPNENLSVAVAGWFHGPENLWLSARCSGPQGNTVLPVIRQPSADLVKIFHSPDADDQRFDMVLPSMTDCGFEPVPAPPKDNYFNLGTASVGITNFAGGTLSIDSLSHGTDGSRGKTALGVLGWIGHFYGRLIPGATALSLVVYTICLVWALFHDRRRRFDAQLIILTGIGTLMLARAAILVLVDISSFPGISQSYWGAGYPLLSLAIVLSLARLSLKEKA